jgi:alanine dehydrogenase
MLLLNNADVESVLTIETTIDALDTAFAEMARAEAVGMGRIDLYIPTVQGATPYYRWAVMTGGSTRHEIVCTRMISDLVEWPVEHGHTRENKYARERGTYCGFMILFSTKDATPIAIINDGVLQHMRVGGGAGLGVKYLARHNTETVGMIGSGGMARTYLDAFCAVRPIKEVKVYSPNRDHAAEYADEVQHRHGVTAVAVPTAREAVAEVDIVSCCTSSTEPVIFADWLRPGMHITNVTSAELEPDLSSRVDVGVRAGEATPFLENLPPEATYARGGFLAYVAGREEQRQQVPRLRLSNALRQLPTLVDLARGTIVGRTNDQQTSLFLNVGAIGVQFAAVAAAVYQRAGEMGIGREIPTDWLLQQVRD